MGGVASSSPSVVVEEEIEEVASSILHSTRIVEHDDYRSEVISDPSPEQDLHSQISKMNRVCVVIPGNPGVPQFYERFIRRLRSACEDRHVEIPTLVVGFVGHHFVDRNHGRIYDLSAQIDHKESFLLHLFDSHPDLELHLVGHSIGCFLIQEVLKRNERINQRVHSAYFVFPTIENLVHSAPWLRFFVVPGLRNFLARAVSLIQYMPSCVRRGIAEKAWRKNFDPPQRTDVIPSEMLDEFSLLLHHRFLLNVMTLAHSEFRDVKDLDVDFIKTYRDRIVYFYTEFDGWVPDVQRDRVKNIRDSNPDQLPCIHEFDGTIPHAFVTTSSDEMADIIAESLTSRCCGISSELSTLDCQVRESDLFVSGLHTSD